MKSNVVGFLINSRTGAGCRADSRAAALLDRKRFGKFMSLPKALTKI